MATYLDAAQMILMETGKPMSLKEITRIAIERGLIIPGGPMPERDMRTLMYVDIKKKGERSRFVHVGINQFMLRGSETTIDFSIIPLKTSGQEAKQQNQAGLTYKKIIQTVLKEEARPMTVLEITQSAIDKGYITPVGKPPVASINTCVYNEIRHQGTASIFIKVGRALIYLRENSLDIQALPDKSKNFSRHETQNKSNNSTLVVNSNLYAIQKEIEAIDLFLMGRLEHRPTDEKLCDWVLLCYMAEKFQEGRDLFPLINSEVVQSWYFEKIRKLARLCSLKVTNYA